MNKEKYYIALGNLQNMATNNTKGSKGVDICVLDINEYVAYLQSKIDKAIDKLESLLPMCIMPNNMLIHGTEKAKAIEETLDILKEDK